jgi:N-acetylmuramoyl-L-alanine amidase
MPRTTPPRTTATRNKPHRFPPQTRDFGRASCFTHPRPSGYHIATPITVRRLIRFLAPLAIAALPATSSAQNINLADTLARWGYGKDTAKTDAMGRWSMKGFSVQAEKNKGWIDLGGVRIWLDRAVIEDNGNLYIARRDFDKSLSPVLAPQAVSVPKLRTIVIDPGHGGKDPGKQNLSLGINEKTMALDVVRRLKFILEAKGYKVFVTRARDNFVELEDRAGYANRLKADLFVSIHFNAGPTSVTGIETYCLTPAGQHSTNDAHSAGDTGEETGNKNDRWNVLLGYYMQKTLVDRLDVVDRGVRRARFAVLRDINCPGVLVECGFMSNPGEAARIATPLHRESLAQGVSDAVALYHARIYKLAQSAAVKKPVAKQ